MWTNICSTYFTYSLMFENCSRIIIIYIYIKFHLSVVYNLNYNIQDLKHSDNFIVYYFSLGEKNTSEYQTISVDSNLFSGIINKTVVREAYLGTPLFWIIEMKMGKIFSWM
jgi:hypothetical protein